jgi:hypothetical protein
MQANGLQIVLSGMQDMHRGPSVFEALFKALNPVSVDLYYASLQRCEDATAETLSAGLVHLYDNENTKHEAHYITLICPNMSIIRSLDFYKTQRCCGQHRNKLDADKLRIIYTSNPPFRESRRVWYVQQNAQLL